jgi:hypothetical protein
LGSVALGKAFTVEDIATGAIHRKDLDAMKIVPASIEAQSTVSTGSAA